MKLKKRRGMTSIMEAIICLILFGVAMTMLLTLMAYSNQWSAETVDAITTKRDTDYLVDMLQMDVKSADEVEVVGNTLQIVNYAITGDAALEGQVTTYSFDQLAHTLYRNSEVAISNVQTGIAGSPPFQMGDDADSVHIRLVLRSKEVLEFTVHR